MSRALGTGWGHVVALTRDTGRTWWRCLPSMLVGLCLGLLGYNALLVVSAFISARDPWLAVITLSVGFACLLVGYLYCLRAIGRELAIGDRLLRSQRGENLVDEPLSRLVAVTLLPFIGIYAVFGKIQQTSGALVTYEVITRGVLEKGVLNTLNPSTLHQRLVVLGVLVASFLLRRVLDWLHERTGWRVFGILTGLVETFFALVLVYGGARLANQAKGWLADRQVALWLRHLGGHVAHALRRIAIHLPDWIALGWHVLVGPTWHWFRAGLGEPLLWLAIAALAFGSRVLSASELLRETIGDRPTRLRRIPRVPAQGTGLRRVLTEFKELFLGDVDDKYVPTLQSLRLVASAGVSLVGAFCLLHALVQLLDRGANGLLHLVIGPNTSQVWVSLGLGCDLFTSLVSEPVRLALLGVTYLRCLHLLEQRAAAATEADAAGSRVSRWPDLLVSIGCVVLAGAVATWAEDVGNTVRVQVRRGDWTEVSRSHQRARIAGVQATQRLRDGESLLTSADRFLVVELVTETPAERVEEGLTCTLHQGDAVLQTVLVDTVTVPEPGYRESTDLVYERPVDGLLGAQLVCQPTDVIRSWNRELVFDLGIDAPRAAAWRGATPAVVANYLPTTEALR